VVPVCNAINVATVTNPDPKARSSRRLHIATLHRSRKPYIRIMIRHWW